MNEQELERSRLETTIFHLYLRGVLRGPSDIHQACKGDNFLLGAVMARIQKHRSQQKNASSQVSGASNAAATAAPGETHPTESKPLRTDREGEGEAESQPKEDSPKQPRRRVSRKVRVPHHKSEESKDDVPRYGCLRYFRQRCCCLRLFW